MSLSRLTATLAVVLPMQMQATEVRVTARCTAAAVTVAAQRVGGEDAPRTATTQCGQTATMQVEPGVWQFRSQTPGTWSPVVTVEVRDAAIDVALHVRTAGRLIAPVALPRGAASPQALDVYLQSSPRRAPGDVEGEHTVRCPIAAGRVTCELPEGSFDLAFRIHGYGTVRLWDQSITRNAPATVAPLRFVPGTTISGWVESRGTTIKDLRTIEVVLQPVAHPSLNDEQRARLKLASRVVRPSGRGFFQFITEPGAYVIEAHAGQAFRSERREVIAVEGSEALLRDALRLERPRELRVQLTPARDPLDRPWTVTLEALDHQLPREMKASAAGTAVFADVFPDVYRVRVGGRDTWHLEEVDTQQTSYVSVVLSVARIDGKVLMAEEPLRAAITFVDGSRRFHTRSVADGRFVVFLPLRDEAVWPRIEVEIANPVIRTTLKDVDLTKRELLIEIPRRGVEGVVVDEFERPVKLAMINVETDSGAVHQVESEDGSFSLYGLAPGGVTLNAYSGPKQTAKPTRVVLSDSEDDVQHVKLQIASASVLRATILSASGPVMGAKVWAPQSTVHSVVVPLTSGPDGEVAAYLPSSVTQVSVSVAMPGFAFRTMRLPVQAEPQQIMLQPWGGELIVDAALTAGTRPYVVHDGVLLRATTFAYLAGGQTIEDSPSRLAFRVPLVEEGAYTLVHLSDAEASVAAAGAVPPHRGATVTVRTGGSATLTKKAEP